MKYKDGRVSLAVGDATVLGPTDCRTRRLPFTVEGRGVVGLVTRVQVPGLLVSPSLSQDGVVRMQVYNASKITKWMTAKMKLVDVICGVEPELRMDPDTICAAVRGPMSIEDWQRQYPQIFAETKQRFACSPLMLRLGVCHKEIKWKIRFEEIPLMNTGVKYQAGELTKAQIEAHLQEMIQRGIIREASLGEKLFMTPAIFLKKPKGGVRKVMDFRSLNAYSEPWTCDLEAGALGIIRSIPREWDTFSSLDMVSGFHNIPVCKRLQQMFGFEHAGKRYTYVTLPQGWSSSSSLFHSRVVQALSGLPVRSYIDDLIVGGKGQQGHDENLGLVLGRLAEMGVYLNAQKTRLSQEKVQFLGYDVSDGKVSLDTFRAKQQAALPKANSSREIRKILGIFNFCRPMVPRLDELTEPVVSELKKKATERQPVERLQRVCEEIWGTIASRNLRLAHGEEGREWHLMCDWSGAGCGYCLWAGPPDNGHLVAINSKRIGEVTGSHLGELKALQWALQDIKSVVAGAKVILWTDSVSVAQRMVLGEAKADVKDIRVARLLAWIWANFPRGERLEVRHVAGAENKLADLLSRWNCQRSNSGKVMIVAEDQVKKVHEEAHWGIQGTMHRLKERQVKATWKEVRDVVRRCPVCVRFLPPKPKDALGEPPFSDRPGEVLYCDVIGPIKPGRAGMAYISTIIDSCTRLCMSMASKDINGGIIVRLLEKWTSQLGVCRTLVTDGASYNKSKVVEAWCKERDILKMNSAPHAHKSLGLVERVQRTLEDRLRKMLVQKGGSWTDHLAKAVMEINTMKHSVTRMTPQEMWNADEKRWGEARARARAARERTNAKRGLLEKSGQ